MAHQKLLNLASAPSGPAAGWMYFDTSLHALGIYDGTDWVYGSGGGGGGGTVDSVVAGTDITVDDTDPANPVVNFSGSIPDDLTDLDIAGNSVVITSPAPGDAVAFNGTNWANIAMPKAGEGAFLAGLSTSLSATTGAHTPFGAVTGGWAITGNAFSWFDGSTGKFTPQVAGLYLLFGMVGFSTEADQNQFLTDIFLNGSLLQRIAFGGVSGTNGGGGSGVMLAHANGSTDFFQLGYFAGSATSLQNLTTYWGAYLIA